jgi:SAM-dependent methyltransferase
VIDLGCGTGEHSILFASKGHRVLGIDLAPRAIAKASAKAAQRGSPAIFRVADALALQTLRRTFDIALDSGLFHVFSDSERAEYVRALGEVLRPGGRYYMLCFSDREPDWGGPRRIRKDEILESFSSGWKVESIRPSTFESFDDGVGAEAWFCKISKDH